MTLLYLKGGSIPDGARWITIHPHGHDEKGQPVLIQPQPDGSAHVVGGAGGALNYLKLRKVRSESEYQKDTEAKRQQKSEERKAQTAKDKAAGLHASKKEAKARVRLQRIQHESKFVDTVAKTMGWDEGKLQFPEEEYKDLSEAAVNKLRENFHREILKEAKAAVDEVRQRILKDADARLQAQVGAVPITSTDDDVISVQDLDPIPTNSLGLGFAAKYAERAEQQGLSADERKAEHATIAAPSAAQREATLRRGDIAKAVAAELKGIKDPLPDLNSKGADLSKAVPLLKAEKALKQVAKKSRDAMREIDESEVEPKAYLLEADEDDADAAVVEDLSNDLRTLKTRAFLSEFGEIGKGDSLGKYVGVGAFNSVNALALAVSGDALVDRSVVDVLGVAGAAQVLARRVHKDLAGGEAVRVAEAMQDFHLDQYMKTSQEAMDRARAFMDEAKSIEVADLESTDDIRTAQELNRRHADAVRHAQAVIGEALGEMEANAALTLALKSPSDKPFQVSLGDTAIDSAITQVRALGLQRGEYTLDRTGGNLFLTVTPTGMERLAKPINREDLEQVRRNLGIINGSEDEEDWLPAGFANRPDLAMDVKPGVAPRLAEPFQPGADLEQSLKDYVGGRAADGDAAADILGDLQSSDFLSKVGLKRGQEYAKALDAVAPIHGEHGAALRAEDLAPRFDEYADHFVDRRYGGVRSPINRQKIRLDGHAADALHRALAETPEGVAAYKQIGELTHGDQRALRQFFSKEVAKESPETHALRQEIEKHSGAEPERKVEDMFGESSDNPDWLDWRNHRDELAGKVSSGELTWERYAEALHGPERAYEAIQDLVRSHVNESFAKTYNTLNPDAPIKVGRATIRHNLAHLDMTDPAQRAKRQEETRTRIDALRERNEGRYAAGGVADKMDAARAAEEAFNQSQMGFFSSEDAPVERPMGGDERHTIGHVVERQIAGMMGAYGKGFDPKRKVKMIQPSMSGPKNIARQRLVKLVRKNKRVVAAFGTGAGKTAIQLGAFTDLKSKGQVKRGAFLVPSVVQGQFAGAAVQFLEPGKFDWHIQPGASRDERIAAYKNPKHDFVVMTHAAFRDDMLHMGAAAAGIPARDMAARVDDMTPEVRQAWMKDLMAREGINFDYLTVDEGQSTLNRQGKENSSLANVVDAVSANTPYYMMASADPVKNDVSEIYDVFRKMDPQRYRDRDAFMRRYGVDTIASKDALRREMARYFYPSKIDPDVHVDRRTESIPLSEGQKLALTELDQHMGAMRLANMEGKADVASARAVSPSSFERAPDEKHEAIARDLAKNAGLLKSAAVRRVISTNPDNPNVERAIATAAERKGKPGIVFAHSLDAVKMLADRMGAAGHKVVMITGADSAQDKDAKREQFQSGAADIMVASDAAAVGMNAQRGEWVYQYDTPDTAMTHAQRQGRINRVGQQNNVELIDAVPDHPDVHRARKRLTEKYGLRDLVTSPLETLDDSGVAYYLKQREVAEAS